MDNVYNEETIIERLHRITEFTREEIKFALEIAEQLGPLTARQVYDKQMENPHFVYSLLLYAKSEF